MKRKLEFIEYTLPAYWASALVNDDYSGLGDIEILELNNWVDAEAKNFEQFYCVSMEEELGFAWDNDATNVGGDIAKFVFQV